MNKEPLWSMSTTVREAERIIGFLKTAKEIEGKEWYANSPAQREFQILLVKNRQYLNDPDNSQSFRGLNEEQIKALTDKSVDMDYSMAESIIQAKKYVGGPEMRGRQSMSPLVKLGLVYYEGTNPKKVKISDVGNRLIKGEINFEDFMCDTLLKYQYPNPSEKGFNNWNTKPFINTLRLIKKVNELCQKEGLKEKGISFDEFGIFVLSLKKYSDVDETAVSLLEFRKELEAIDLFQSKIKFINSYTNKYLGAFNNPLKNCREYADNVIRYMRMTKYIYIRGKYDNTYIDLEPRRMIEINEILSHDEGKAEQFTQEGWNSYIGTFGAYKLPFENEKVLKQIAGKIVEEIKKLTEQLGEKFTSKMIPTTVVDLKNFIEEQRKERTYLQNLLIRNEVHKDLARIDDAIENLNNIKNYNSGKLTKKLSIELEKWSNVALNIINDAVSIKPNYSVGDDNEPLYTAASGKPDIECIYKNFVAICEVTMLKSRDQWYNEGQPVMRHLRDFENKHADKPNYCLFIAPKIHQDTINTFFISVKYEYEGRKQNIIPMTITQLNIILQVVKEMLHKKGNFSHLSIKQLYDSCIDLSNVQNSKHWLGHINNCIEEWKQQQIA